MGLGWLGRAGMVTNERMEQWRMVNLSRSIRAENFGKGRGLLVSKTVGASRTATVSGRGEGRLSVVSLLWYRSWSAKDY